MKKKLISLILTLIQLSVDFSLVITGGALIFGTILVIFTPFTGFANKLFDHHSWWSLTLQAIDVFLIIAFALIMMLGIHSLLRNINSRRYFVGENLRAVQQILYPAIAIFALQSLTTICFHFWNIQDLSGLMTFHEGDFDSNLFFIIIFFLIYLIFKRGIALQKDADEII